MQCMLDEDAPSRDATMGELRKFLAENKVWWITPIVIVLLFVGFMFYLVGTGSGELEDDSPFVYDLH